MNGYLDELINQNQTQPKPLFIINYTC